MSHVRRRFLTHVWLKAPVARRRSLWTRSNLVQSPAPAGGGRSLLRASVVYCRYLRSQGSSLALVDLIVMITACLSAFASCHSSLLVYPYICPSIVRCCSRPTEDHWSELEVCCVPCAVVTELGGARAGMAVIWRRL